MSNNTIPQKLYEVLKEVVNGDIEKFSIQIHDPNKKGEGYLGEIFFISLLNKLNGKQIHFAVKQAFSDEFIRREGPIRELFLNEIYFYTKVWPKFEKFQKLFSSELKFPHIPKCFAVTSEDSKEKLVLENLKYQGFLLHDKKLPLEKQKFEYIFRIYGKYHAITYAYKKLHPKEFSILADGLLDLWLNLFDKKELQEIIKTTHEQCLNSLRSGEDHAAIDKYKKYIEDGVSKFFKTFSKGKYSTIIHGDCWSNNMMFKYDESGMVTDIRLLDFQLSKVGSPVCDLSYCLYSGGTKEIYDDLDHLLQIYHNSFSENVRAYGCDPDELFPLEALKNDWKEYSYLGVTMGLMMWRGKLTFDEEILDLTDMEDNKEDGMKKYYETKYDEKGYQERTRDIIIHLYENNFM